MSYYAVSAARMIWDNDPIQLLRRLPVIIVEDAIVHPGLLGIVWLMMAQSPSYQYDECDMYQVLAVVRDAALVSARDHFDKIPDDTDPPVQYTGAHKSTCASVGAALMLRYSYGGITADMAMVHFAERRWHARANDPFWENFVSSIVFTNPRTKLEACLELGGFPRDLLDAGADFHCFPSMMHPFSKVPRMQEYVFQFKSGLQANRLLTLRGSSAQEQKSAAMTFVLGPRMMSMGSVAKGRHLKCHNPSHDLDIFEWLKHEENWNRLAVSYVNSHLMRNIAIRCGKRGQADIREVFAQMESKRACPDPYSHLPPLVDP